MSIRNYIKKNRRQSSIAYSTICSGATSLNTPQLAAGSFIRNDSFERRMYISHKDIHDKYSRFFSDWNCYCIGKKTDFLNPRTVLFLKVGICGGFTTFSSFALETTDLMKNGKMHLAVIYTVLSVTLGVLAVFAGQGIVGKG